MEDGRKSRWCRTRPEKELDVFGLWVVEPVIGRLTDAVNYLIHLLHKRLSH